MFGTIRKHQTWLWAVIITLTIISFVIFFSPYSKMNSGRQGGNYGSINGERITQQQFAEARREVDLHYFFMTGQWPEQDKQTQFDPMRETYQWLLLDQKQQQYGIHVGDDVAAQVAQQLIHPFQRMGVSSPQVFIDKILVPHGLTVDDFERFVRHYVGVQELITLVGLPGKLVTPQQAQSLYKREHQELATDSVFFSASNYLAKVTTSPQAISQFYSNRQALYLIPERVQVSYVKFNATNFLSQAETQLKSNLTEIVEANFEKLGTNYVQFGKTPEEAKAKIREEILHRKALDDAKRKTLEFANALFDMQPVRPENLQQLAKKQGLTVGVTQPFDREEGPKDLDVDSDFVRRAFELTSLDPFAGPIVAPDGVYEIALVKKIPTETPPLDQVRSRVTADYQHSQAVALARQAGMAFYHSLTNGLAHGKSFTNLCVEAKLTPVKLPPFSLATRELPGVAEDRYSLNQLKQAAFSITPGQASNLYPTSDGGFLLYVKNKLPLDTAQMKADMPRFLAAVRRSRQQEAFQEWFRKEAEQGLRDTPLARPRTPPPSSLDTTAKAKS